MKARIKAPPRIPPENQQQFIIPFLSPLCMMWLGVCCQLSPGDRDNCLMFGVCRAHRGSPAPPSTCPLHGNYNLSILTNKQQQGTRVRTPVRKRTSPWWHVVRDTSVTGLELQKVPSEGS